MGRRALIVEDEAVLRDFLTMDLKASGFEVQAVGDGLAASEALSSHSFDVVVSDFTIPNRSGVDLFKEVCESSPHERPAFVLISGDFPLPQDELYALGIEHCIDKPFSRQTLVDTIQRLTLPPAERWANRKGLAQPVAELEMRFDSVASAQKEKVFSIGKSGFFVASSDHAKLNDAVDFKISFERLHEASENQPLNGRALVRWVREKTNSVGPAGMGLEIAYLAPTSMRTFEEIVASLQPKACIPRT